LVLPRPPRPPASRGLGWRRPASMGAALAAPIRPVVAIIGDGSAHSSISALRTAAEENIGVIIVLLSNGTYGALDWFADLLEVDKAPGPDLGEGDFGPMCAGSGMHAEHAGSADGFDRALSEAIDRAGQGRASLIEVNTEKTRPEKE